MITDNLLYKPVILFNVFCGIIVYSNLVLIPNFISLKVSMTLVWSILYYTTYLRMHVINILIFYKKKK